MRKEGVDYPDPQLSGGQVLINPGQLDPNDPAVARAQQACADKLPDSAAVAPVGR